MSGKVLKVHQLRIEHVQDTLGIGVDSPRLSWQIETKIPNWVQAGYEIECHGKIHREKSSQSVLVKWPFEPLQSREQINVRIRVWGTNNSESEWSQPTIIEAGLLKSSDWNASFITPNWDEDNSISNPCPYLRREFELGEDVQSARLYITSLGVYQGYLNGYRIGDQVLSPGWTVYDQRLRYQTFDVTSLLQTGNNTIGAILGDGWFRGRIGFGGGKRNTYGENLALLAQLEVKYVNGKTETIVSDESWSASTGAILSSSIYDGEIYDARLEPVGWSQTGFDSSQWKSVRKIEWDLEALEAMTGPPVRRIEKIKPVSISQSPSGKTIVDFGQNLVGRLNIKVKGQVGQTITFHHAEVLENGELCTRPLRFADATDKYTLKGGALETWEPFFTFHGFRYAEVSGWPGELTSDDISAVVLHSDLERTGWFECSDPLLNRLHENVIWSMRGNFLDIPTDCPQRDERLGWTGDIQVFSPTASFLYDESGFLQSWLKDLAIEQQKLGGIVPSVVPNIIRFGAGAAAWGDAATVIPWVLYQRFGDKQLLSDQFKSMCDWVDQIIETVGEDYLWTVGFQFGDWLDPTSPPDKPAQARTDKTIVASAYFAHSLGLVASAAEVLGKTIERDYYSQLAERAKSAFLKEFVTPAGRLMSDAETAYALALVFDLLSTEKQQQHAGNRLNELVQDSGYHIRTGFVGTPLICDALCRTGHYQAAYRLLAQTECPSWLYPVTMGATTIWERWDSMLPDGSINPGEMTSFNHYAFGAIADWMHRTIGGITLIEPGYHRIEISPRPGGGITQAQTSHLTPYGMVECNWRIDENNFKLEVIIPPNTSANVILSEGECVEVGSGRWNWNIPYQDPDSRGPYTADDLVGEIMSDKVARDAVMQTIAHLDDIELITIILTNEKKMTLRQALGFISNSEDILTKIVDVLGNLKD